MTKIHVLENLQVWGLVEVVQCGCQPEGSKHQQKKQQRSLPDDHDKNADGRANDESSDDGAIPIQTGSPRQEQQEQ